MQIRLSEAQNYVADDGSISYNLALFLAKTYQLGELFLDTWGGESMWFDGMDYAYLENWILTKSPVIFVG